MYKMNICFTITDNYTLYLSTAILSILKNSKKNEEFHFYILNAGDISPENKRKINRLKTVKDFELYWVTVDKRPFLNLAGGCHYTTNFRLKVCSLLPNLDRLLFLDTDMIILDSLADLYNTDLSNGKYWAAGVIDPCPNKEIEVLGSDFKNVEIFNTGVLLIDAIAWRKNHIEEKLFKTLSWFSTLPAPGWPDQSSINYTLNGKIKKVHPRYNACPILAFQHEILPPGFLYENTDVQKKAFEKPCILHYCAGFIRTPSSTLSPSSPYIDYYWDYMKESPFFHEFLERQAKIESLNMFNDNVKQITKRKYSKWFVSLVSCFIPSTKNRNRFRKNHTKKAKE